MAAVLWDLDLPFQTRSEIPLAELSSSSGLLDAAVTSLLLLGSAPRAWQSLGLLEKDLEFPAGDAEPSGAVCRNLLVPGTLTHHSSSKAAV